MSTSIDNYILFSIYQLEKQTSFAGLFLVPYETLYKVMSPTVYHESSVRHSVNGLCAEKLLEKEFKDNISYIALTRSGREKVNTKYPSTTKGASKLPISNDESWWLITFEVPENSRNIRDSLREELIQFGFTPWQKSLYVYPKGTSKDALIEQTFWREEYRPYIALSKITDVLSSPSIREAVANSYEIKDMTAKTTNLSREAVSIILKLNSRALNTKQYNSVLVKARQTAKDLFDTLHELSLIPDQLVQNIDQQELLETYDKIISGLVSA